MMRESSPSPSQALNRDSVGESSSTMKNLKYFDIYQKIDESFRIQTTAGAFMSLAGWFVIFILVMAEFRNYMTPKYNELLIVDSTFGEQMRVNINITFHSLTCNEAHLDVMDVSGDNQLNVEHLMLKQRLTPDGKPIGVSGLEVIGERNLDIPKNRAIDFCGSCYGAETPNRKCCNTCGDLIQAYQDKDWNIGSIIRNASQCINERAEHFAQVAPGEGCTISGTMKINKVSGNFHIAHGESVVRDSHHLHHFNPVLAPKFNVSHTINYLSFGDPYPNMPKGPLNQVQKIIAADKSTGLFQYFIKVIPTVYKEDSGKSIRTNQYTVSDRFRPFVMPKMDGSERFQEAVLPGIFFVYDISPFMIEADSHQMPFFHFLTKVCAIVGGVFTVLGVIDSIIYKLTKLTKKVK